MRKVYLFLLVFISGAAVLAVEILGTRMLGPFYGVSLFLWSALISVTLVALSIGYAVGGRLADSNATLSRLCIFVAAAGLWVLLTPWLRGLVLVTTESLGLRAAVLVTALVLFAPPLTLLGMVSPYAIRIMVPSLKVIGRTAGDLYACSTVGSVISALATGFILIPNVGVVRLAVLIGVVLVLTAATGLAFENSRKATVSAIAIGLLLSAVALVTMPSNEADPDKGLIAIEQSPFAEIRVVDMSGKRHLLIDGGVHTIVDPLTWESHLAYSAVVDLAGESFDEPGSLLLVGLGGGAIAKNFARAGWSLDAVEIDPVVIDMAQEYFGLKQTDGTLYEMDGRQFLLQNSNHYDLIVMDAFGSSSIPFHLVTKESFELIKARLSSDGLLVINLESRKWRSLLVRSIAATLAQHFSNVLALPVESDPEALGNVILIASNRGLAERVAMPQWQIPSREYLKSPDYRRDLAWDNRFEPEIADGQVLTDDLNPVDIWAEAVNLTARQGLHAYFKNSDLNW